MVAKLASGPSVPGAHVGEGAPVVPTLVPARRIRMARPHIALEAALALVFLGFDLACYAYGSYVLWSFWYDSALCVPM